MTHVRRPNRRPIKGLDDLVNGGVCPRTFKQRLVDERVARQVQAQMARTDPRPESLAVYRCVPCGDWHVGHRMVSG